MSAIAVSRHGATLCLEIDNVAKRNAIDMAMFTHLADELVRADRDDAVSAVLLCGAGAGFTAGHDLDAFDQWPQGASDPVPRFLHALAAMCKPLVVAVQGWAVGIGATCLLHADWVLAAPAAKLRFPFIDLGIAPEAASSLLLARCVGSLRARRLLLGGEAVLSEEAHQWGLVTELCPVHELRASAIGRAALLGAKPAESFARLKGWIARPDEVHARIDEEIDAINQALAARRTASALRG